MRNSTSLAVVLYDRLTHATTEVLMTGFTFPHFASGHCGAVSSRVGHSNALAQA